MQENSTLFNTGYDLMLQERYEEAITFFEAYRQQNPNYAPCFNNIGLCNLRLGTKEKNNDFLETAIQYFNRALNEIEPWESYPSADENLKTAMEELEKLK